MAFGLGYRFTRHVVLICRPARPPNFLWTSRAFHEHKDFAVSYVILCEKLRISPRGTLMAACGWRALMARMAAPLSGMATSDHSCSGDAPLGFGSTVTIFHPVVMHLRLTSSLVSAHPRTSTRRPISLPRPASRGECLAIIGSSPRAAVSLRLFCNKDRNPPGGALLVFRVRQIRRNGKLPEPGMATGLGLASCAFAPSCFPVCIPKLVSGSNRINRASIC